MLRGRCMWNLEITVTLMEKQVVARSGPHIPPSPSAVPLPHRRIQGPSVDLHHGMEARCHRCRPIPPEEGDSRSNVSPLRDDFCCICVSPKKGFEELKMPPLLCTITFSRRVFLGWCFEFQNNLLQSSFLTFPSNVCVFSG